MGESVFAGPSLLEMEGGVREPGEGIVRQLLKPLADWLRVH